MTNATTIHAENLSKCYRIGLKEESHDTFGGMLVSWAKSPINNFSRLRRLSNFDDVEGSTDSADVLWALRDVSFEVKQGEALGIIGRNGAGKSTLLKMLSRITEPTTGCVEMRGRVASLLEVGTGFHPDLTGRENIYLNGTILGMTKREVDAKFDEIVDFSGVERFIDTPVKRYSSGMTVRLAFAVAAHLDPEILLIDEVLAVGDTEFQKKCLGKMEDVTKEGRTVLFISHNMFAVQNLCERAMLLESGRLSAIGSVGDVVRRYLAGDAKRSGEMCWSSPDTAPGSEKLRLKAVRLVSEGLVTATPDISKDLRIEIDYWNTEPGGRRLVSVHLRNQEGICVFTSGNLPSTCTRPDPWYERPYPVGLFRTTCTIPADFMNDGLHTISLFINQRKASDHVVVMRDMISFEAQDSGAMRREYTGKWFGVVRPRLDWRTELLDDALPEVA